MHRKTTRDRKSRLIWLGRVLQGYPLSLMMLNVTLDPNLNSLPTEMGSQINPERVNYLVNADDTVLAATAESVYKVPFHRFASISNVTGSELNPQKCGFLHLFVQKEIVQLVTL